jgi:CCR4-NOT transcription complex subunit 6
MAFRVATYNVLAAAYAAKRLYPRTPANVLDANYRTAALPAYLLRLDADILCLQEVEAETFAIVADKLSDAGFVAAFTKKGNSKPDGCAILARHSSAVWLSDTHIAYDDAPGGQSSGHVVQVVSLRVDDRVLAVANTHLKWDPPGRPRDAQIGVRQIEQLLAERSRLVPNADAWIITGDLNVTPDSAVVATLQSAGFQFSHVDVPAPTCNANHEARMLDYLFHDAPLTATPVPILSITDDTPIPSVDEPSDHVPVSATFHWTTS